MIFDAFLKTIFLAGEMGVAASLAPKGLGPQDPTKKLARWVDLLGHQLSQKKLKIAFPVKGTAIHVNISINDIFIGIE